MTVKKVTRILSIFFTLVLINLSAYAKDNSSQNHKNFLWKVQSKTSIVYLLGSIHFFKKEVYPLDKRIENAFDKSDILVVEANIDDVSQIDLEKLIEGSLYPEKETLEGHVSKATYELVMKEVGALGVPPEFINKEKPWFLALTLTS